MRYCDGVKSNFHPTLLIRRGSRLTEKHSKRYDKTSAGQTMSSPHWSPLWRESRPLVDHDHAMTPPQPGHRQGAREGTQQGYWMTQYIEQKTFPSKKIFNKIGSQARGNLPLSKLYLTPMLSENNVNGSPLLASKCMTASAATYSAS